MFVKGIELGAEILFCLYREAVKRRLVLASENNAFLHVFGHWKAAKPSREKAKFMISDDILSKINSKSMISMCLCIFHINILIFFEKKRNNFL